MIRIIKTLDRNRVAVVVLSIIAICGLCWAYLVYQIPSMPAMKMGAMMMPATHPWGITGFITMFTMWSIMMVAMMLPSATPMILLFARVNQKQLEQGRGGTATGFFVAGYLLVWVGFSVVATGLNWGLHVSGLMTSMMGRTTPVVAGISLFAAGVYQWTPLKYACLTHCRSPIEFLTNHWQKGGLGAVRMGIHHGYYCLGCCWLLMVLLFVLGVMNLLWIAALTLFVLIEKVLPAGLLLSRISGLFMIAWGGWMIGLVV